MVLTMKQIEDTWDNNQGQDSEVDGSEVDGSEGSEAQRKEAVAQKRQAAQEEKRKILDKNQRRVVTGLRIAVLSVLVLTTALVSTGVYLYTSKDQEDDFETEFFGFADRIMDSVHTTVEHKLGAIDSLSVTYTSYALNSGSTFPNVTLPDFEIRGASARVVADSTFFRWMPLVTDETRAGWEAYAAQNHMWLERAYVSERKQTARQDALYNLTGSSPPGTRRLLDLALQSEPERDLLTRADEQDLLHDRALQEQPDNRRFIPYIFDLVPGRNHSSPEGSGPYLVYWQTSPVLPVKGNLNFNMLSHPGARPAVQTVLRTGKGVLHLANNINKRTEGDDHDESNAYTQFNLFNGQYRHEVETFLEMPLSPVNYPVFDNFGPNRKVAGVLATNFYWYQYFTDLLPETAGAVMAVLENTFNQTFSFRVDGQGVEYLGPGDFHDTKYDHLVVSENVAESVEKRARPATRSFTTVPLDQTYGSYFLHVYPTQDLEDNYVDKRPMLYAVIVAAIFAFSTAVFLIYDLLVQRQQRMVMSKAIQSGTIVASLFPEAVRDRLFDEEEDKRKGGQGTGGKWHADKAGDLKNFMEEDGKVKSDSPIADLYPECSVFFCDIAGFTKWSSGRTPCEVFELLETIYGQFDAIAARRGVFKIETIGDCYLAVTGLPKPQSDHAVIMCKFASECMRKMDTLMQELSDTLGADTVELGMRAGIHSGPVTAGVLRGQKSRFQLFGDTVNTASRMESNGQKGRIQISETTAEELRASGRSHWLEARPEKVQAKGKGEMQTYWVTVPLRGTKTGTSNGRSSTSGESISGRSEGSTRELEPLEDDVVREVQKEKQHSESHPDSEQEWRRELKEKIDRAMNSAKQVN